MQNMTSGGPLGLILKFTGPLLLANVFQQLNSISDVLIVGNCLGVNALAAVGAAMPIFFFLIVVGIGFSNGLAIIVAQSYGARDYARMRQSVFTASILGVSFTTIFSIILLCFLRPFLHVMNVPENIFTDTFAFARTIAIGGLFIVIFNFLSALMRALGDSKTPLYFFIFNMLLNIAFNLAFIKYCHLGVMGSALGTVCAMGLSSLLCLGYMLRHFRLLYPTKGDRVLTASFCWEHLRIATPMAIQFAVLGVSLMIKQSVCNQFGSETIGALTAAIRVEQIATMPMVSIGVAMGTYVAQNYGAGHLRRIKKAVDQVSLLSLLTTILLACFTFYWGASIVRLFLKDATPAIVKISQTYFYITIPAYFFLGQIFIYRNTCQGMGNAVVPMLSSFVELGMRIFAAVYLSHLFGFTGLCFSEPIAWIGAACVVYVGYKATLSALAKRKRICKIIHAESV